MQKFYRRSAPVLLSLAVWLLLWQMLSLRLDAEILLLAPRVVFRRFCALLVTAELWTAVLFSFVRIAAGFLLGLLCGASSAALSARFRAVKEFLSPAMALIKASPVASFTILLLTWVPSRNLSVVIAFLMALPVIYTNLLAGISATDPLLLEMADLFGVGRLGRLRCIYLSQVLPFRRSGCGLALGLCWKAGVAAEVIGIPAGSIGERLYESKIYYDIPGLFAWTVVIILMSLLFGRIFLALLDSAMRTIERM